MTAPPSSLPLVEPYFDAWNARDPEAVAATFAEGGTYTDPTVTGPPLTGAAITEHARALLTAFPDLSLEILSGHPADGGQVTAQWLLHGTNTGMWNGQPPTGQPVAMRGVDVFGLTAGKITSVEGYFDRQTMAEQLGFQMRPLPTVAGPFQFGYAVRASTGSTTTPGAFSLTWIDARSDQEAEEIKLTAAVVAVELAQQAGFLSWVGMEIGQPAVHNHRVGEPGRHPRGHAQQHPPSGRPAVPHPGLRCRGKHRRVVRSSPGRHPGALPSLRPPDRLDAIHRTLCLRGATAAGAGVLVTDPARTSGPATFMAEPQTHTGKRA